MWIAKLKAQEMGRTTHRLPETFQRLATTVKTSVENISPGDKNKERGRVSTLDINATEETHSAKKEGSWVCQKLRHDPL
jgi:hypothetical protein